MGQVEFSFYTLFPTKNGPIFTKECSFFDTIPPTESILSHFFKRVIEMYKKALRKEILSPLNICTLIHLNIEEGGYRIDDIFIIHYKTAKFDLMKMMIRLISEIRNSLLIHDASPQVVFDYAKAISDDILYPDDD